MNSTLQRKLYEINWASDAERVAFSRGFYHRQGIDREPSDQWLSTPAGHAFSDGYEFANIDRSEWQDDE